MDQRIMFLGQGHNTVHARLVQSFQLSVILIILLYYRYIHFLFSNTPMKAKTVTV